MTKTAPGSGLTIDQIDAITLEICHAEALAWTLHGKSDGGTDASLFKLLERQLAKVKEMVLDCQIGGRRYV
jgi:hypothetical protein